MKISEVVLSVVVLALITGAYFYIRNNVINPPSRTFGVAAVPQETNPEKLQQMQQEQIEAKQERDLRKFQKQLNADKPELDKIEDYYNKQYGYISKLPPKKQEKELQRIMEKQQQDAEKSKKLLPRQ